MDYEELKSLVNKGLSSYEIAKITKRSATNVRRWMKKYGLIGVYSRVIRSCKRCGKQCRAQYCSNKCKCADYYNKNKTQINSNTYERQKQLGKERKLLLIEMHGGGCTRCGYSKVTRALEFHHLRDKDFGLCERNLGNRKWENILKEQEKCILLCSNCHAEEHSN